MRYSVGLGLLVDDAETVGRFARDELLFAFTDNLSDYDDYEVREILRGDLPLCCPIDPTDRELVMLSRHPDVGGPLDEATSNAIIAEIDGIGRSGQLDVTPPPFGPRGVLLPPFVPPQGVLPIEGDHPFAELPFFNMVAAAKTLESLDGSEHLRALLGACTKHLLAVSFLA